MRDFEVATATAALDAQAALARAGRLQKTFARPLAMLSSKAIEVVASRLRIGVPVSAHTFWGEPMQVIFPDRVSVQLFRYGFFEESLTSLIMRVLRQGMCFFDVGSHMGYYALLAARLVGSAGAVHCFEPTPRTRAVLKRNVQSHPQVLVNDMAVGASLGYVSFQDLGAELAAFNTFTEPRLESTPKAIKTVRAPLTTIDEYCASHSVRPSFIKIDAEGAEFDIIQGARRTLAEVRPLLTLEVGDVTSQASRTSRECIDLLIEQGYAPMDWHAGRITPHKLQAKYTYGNLLFVPKRYADDWPESWRALDG